MLHRLKAGGVFILTRHSANSHKGLITVSTHNIHLWLSPYLIAAPETLVRAF